MAKQIKKGRKELTEAQKAERAAKKAERVRKLIARYQKAPGAFIVRAQIKGLNAVLTNLQKPTLNWAEFCDAKIKATAEFWTAKKAAGQYHHQRKPMTAEQVAKKQEKLAALVKKIESEKAALAEAMKLLGK